MEQQQFGARVKARRTELKLTQAQLGEIVGVSQVAIKKIEAGGSTRHGRKIAEALNTTLEILETGSGHAPQQGAGQRPQETPEIDDWPLRKCTPDRFYALDSEQRIRADVMINGVLEGFEMDRKSRAGKRHTKRSA